MRALCLFLAVAAAHECCLREPGFFMRAPTLWASAKTKTIGQCGMTYAEIMSISRTTAVSPNLWDWVEAAQYSIAAELSVDIMNEEGACEHQAARVNGVTTYVLPLIDSSKALLSVSAHCVLEPGQNQNILQQWKFIMASASNGLTHTCTMAVRSLPPANARRSLIHWPSGGSDSSDDSTDDSTTTDDSSTTDDSTDSDDSTRTWKPKFGKKKRGGHDSRDSSDSHDSSDSTRSDLPDACCVRDDIYWICHLDEWKQWAHNTFPGCSLTWGQIMKTELKLQDGCTVHGLWVGLARRYIAMKLSTYVYNGPNCCDYKVPGNATNQTVLQLEASALAWLGNHLCTNETVISGLPDDLAGVDADITAMISGAGDSFDDECKHCFSCTDAPTSAPTAAPTVPQCPPNEFGDGDLDDDGLCDEEDLCWTELDGSIWTGCTPDCAQTIPGDFADAFACFANVSAVASNISYLAFFQDGVCGWYDQACCNNGAIGSNSSTLFPPCDASWECCSHTGNWLNGTGQDLVSNQFQCFEPIPCVTPAPTPSPPCLDFCTPVDLFYTCDDGHCHTDGCSALWGALVMHGVDEELKSYHCECRMAPHQKKIGCVEVELCCTQDIRLLDPCKWDDPETSCPFGILNTSTVVVNLQQQKHDWKHKDNSHKHKFEGRKEHSSSEHSKSHHQAAKPQGILGKLGKLFGGKGPHH